MELTNQFYPLFRQEAYAVQLALYEDADLANPFEQILRERRLPAGTIWDKEYSVCPVGELSGREEAEPIPQGNVTMGYDAYGAVGIEASVKIGLSIEMQEYSRRFAGAGGQFPESGFAGYLADQHARGILSRKAHKWHDMSADIFNFGAIPAGHVFFNQRIRANHISDLPNSQLIYDVRPLFAFANNPHPAFASGLTVGPGSAPTGTICGWAGTAGAAIADTGGFFNAFTFPPALWALKRVLKHYENNVAYDETAIPYQQTADTLLVSSHDEMTWREILKSQFVVGLNINTENIFQLDRFKLKLVVSRLLIRGTWFVGKANSSGIYLMRPDHEPEPWAFWREEDNRSYWMSYEARWGFMIRNWRYWIGGSVSIDGATAPNYGTNEQTWYTTPVN